MATALDLICSPFWLPSFAPKRKDLTLTPCILDWWHHLTFWLNLSTFSFCRPCASSVLSDPLGVFREDGGFFRFLLACLVLHSPLEEGVAFR